MWHLSKPNLLDVKSDLDIAFPNENQIDIDVKNKIKKIYDLYDTNEGKPDGRYNPSTICDAKKDIIHSAYKKTHKNEELHYIKEALFDKVEKCPICGIDPPYELDHVLPQSKFKLLSINRQNLVPLCHPCNHQKGILPAEKFTHIYFDNFPKECFFNCEIVVVQGSITIEYNLDAAKFVDQDLYRRASFQLQQLCVKEKINKEAFSFISDIFPEEFSTDDAFQLFIDGRLQVYKLKYGLNDWRTALFRGIKNNLNINKEVIKNTIVRAKNEAKDYLV